MKRILNSLFLVATLALIFSVNNSYAQGNYQGAIVQYLDKIRMSEYRDYNDATLMKIKSSVSSVINITSATLCFSVPVSTLDFTYAEYDTLGELCDYIEGLDNLTCSLTGGKRDDSSILLWDSVSNQSISGAAGYEVAIGTGGVDGESGSYINRIGITPQSGRRVILKYCNVTNDGTGTLEIYGKLRKYESVSDGVTRNDTTVALKAIATANDTAEVDGNIYGGYWLEFADNAHVVISAGNASTAQSSTSSLECYWDEE